MAWRGLHLTNPGKLSYARGQAVVAQGEAEVTLPLEDVAWIVIDTPQMTVTSAFLSACMNSGVVLILCDAAHIPSGLVLPFHRHHRQAAVAATQTGISAPLRKRLWQAVVQSKIRNQAAALVHCGKATGPLNAMAARVQSGDPDNVEARAARAYWSSLFEAFTRDDPADLRNAQLNYGYAVVRGTVARGLVAAGLLPAFGIGHRSVTNPFNLADDMIEPFRPFVDVAVWTLSSMGSVRAGELTLDHRRILAALPGTDVTIGTETVTLLVAAERVAETLVQSMKVGIVGPLTLPSLPRRQGQLVP